MIKRRDFIKKSVTSTAGIAVGGMGFSANAYRSIIGANERINAAVIGLRNQGGYLINQICDLSDDLNVHINTLCDVDEQILAERVKEVFEKRGITTKYVWDMRRIFDDKEIDAVWIATPNHWHALSTIWACQAGKHVYVEKPCSYNIFEGRKMIEAARKYNVRVQTGHLLRATNTVWEAIKFLHNGGIGKVYMARGLYISIRESFGIAPNSKPPDNLHYDMWLGPAAYQPYNEKKVHYNWHWHWNTGNGATGNTGPHQFDIARWGLNKTIHPISVFSTGGLYGWDPEECSQETPDTQSSLFKYGDGTMLEFETRTRYSNTEGLDIGVGNIFYGTEGFLELTRAQSWRAYRRGEREPFAGSELKTVTNPEIPLRKGHSENFINAIRSGNNEDLYCDILEGHYSDTLPHLANISYRLGRELKFIGEYEKFADDSDANLMLTRNYRNPFVVPNKV